MVTTLKTPKTRPPGDQVRPAGLADVPALVDIETRSFETDRLSTRNFRYLLTQGKATTLVAATPEGGLLGYAMALFNRGAPLARLYSIAVAPEVRSRGVGRRLLRAIEADARARDAAFMRLEVRADDGPTQAFYRSEGYRPFAVHAHYYDNAVDALRMEKPLATGPRPEMARIPFYHQTLEFTCGPAALMMAMHALDPATRLDQTTELRLWREATTIFMTSGLGGCGPRGLALAAHRRGFDVTLMLGDKSVMFLDSVRSPHKKEVLRLVHEDFRQQVEEAGIPVSYGHYGLVDLRRHFTAGGVPLILTSSYRFDRTKKPHWVVVTGFDGRYVYVHDPYVDAAAGKTATDCMQIPVLEQDFERMACYGSQRHRAVVILKKRGG
jgi:ribosomal protein S18 acetylase RimI-like enzyme